MDGVVTSTDQARALWDAEAVTFDEAPDHGLADPETRAAWRELLLAHLPPAPARVADLGCGTGTLSVLLADEGYVTAMWNLGMADWVASDPDLPAGAFDVVLSRHVLWALPDPVAGLRRWCDLLAPGGRLLLVEGRWFNDAGLSAADTESLLSEVDRSAVVRHLPEPVFWGREIDDERYLVLSKS